MSAGWDTTPTAQLGVCVSPDELVPGDTASMTGYADRLRRISSGAARVSWLLNRVDAGALVGGYGAELRQRLAVEPAPYEQTALSLAVAADAVDELVSAVEDARVVARQAVGLWNQAQSTSRAWDTARQLHEDFPGPVPVPAAADPGEELREQAHRLLEGAQHDVATAAERTRAVLHEVARAAPRRDGGYGEGAVDAWKGILALGKSAVTAPLDTAGAVVGAVVGTLEHPVDSVGDAAKDAMRTPDEFVGGTLATAGVGAAARVLTRIEVRDAPVPRPNSKEPRPFNFQGPPIPESTFHHVLDGEFPGKKPHGYHHRVGGVDPKDRDSFGPRTEGPMGTYRIDGVRFTRADGKQKVKPTSSFFPDHWSRFQVRVAVTQAWQGPHRNIGPNGTWSGYSFDGLRIIGYIGPDGLPVTAYPDIP